MLLFLQGSDVKQTDNSMVNNDEDTKLSSVCDQATPTEDVLDLAKKQSKEDIPQEQGTTLQSQSQNETEV